MDRHSSFLRRPMSSFSSGGVPRAQSCDRADGPVRLKGARIVPDPPGRRKGLLAANNTENSEVRTGRKARGDSGNAIHCTFRVPGERTQNGRIVGSIPISVATPTMMKELMPQSRRAMSAGRSPFRSAAGGPRPRSLSSLPLRRDMSESTAVGWGHPPGSIVGGT